VDAQVDEERVLGVQGEAEEKEIKQMNQNLHHHSRLIRPRYQTLALHHISLKCRHHHR
jgi:hypothetical protein